MITVAILKSLEERLLRLTGRRVAGNLADEILKIGGRCAAFPDVDARNPDEILGYDADGTPRWMNRAAGSSTSFSIGSGWSAFP